MSVQSPAPLRADAEVDGVWELLRAENPRLHDGPVLLIDHEGRCSCSTYRTLATAARLGRTIRSLGVQGLVIGRDATGGKHVLFGRRSRETRIYGGMWENAPSGTVTPPDETIATLGLPHLAAALRGEGLEELGIDLADSEIRWLAMLEDPEAMSVDAVLEVRPRRPIQPRAAPCRAADSGRWEYIDTAWVADEDLPDWTRRCVSAISPPTLALLEWRRTN